jgi:two-component system alkaline phosphatase synthesis response regulator PhoP
VPDLITIIEDDESIREMLRYYFHSVGYGVEDFESGEDYFQAVHDVQPDLYILDIMLPGMDGLEILRRLRGAPDTAHIPVIMLTARTAELDRVKGLEQGADDYVGKPFGIMELQARVTAVLRRTGRPQTPAILKCDGLEIDPAAREVRRDGIPVELTYKEFELLKLLCENRGTVLTRDDILHAVWDYDFAGETRTVDMHVKTLRQKLGEGYIQTVRGVGYKMP